MNKDPRIKEEFWRNKAGWRKSFIDGFSQDENGDALPWMTYGAINFLQKSLNQNQKIFELGAGASTLFFATKVAKVVSLETNSKWAEIMQSMVTQYNFKNVEIILMEDGLTNNAYENFPRNFPEQFDLIIIDSLKRFKCAKNSVDALGQGGSIILDDSERKHYQKVFDFFCEKNFLRQDFVGIAPGQIRLKNTSIFTR